MDSPEGLGHARDRWIAWHHAVPEDVLGEAYGDHAHRMRFEDLPDDVQDDVTAAILERSELIGFWIAWHQAGGFARLERGGWHRATIFRKVRRFRATFDAHPDAYDFPWITLDLSQAWRRDLLARLAAAAGRDPIPDEEP